MPDVTASGGRIVETKVQSIEKRKQQLRIMELEAQLVRFEIEIETRRHQIEGFEDSIVSTKQKIEELKKELE